MWEMSAGVMKREEQSTVGEEMCRGNMVIIVQREVSEEKRADVSQKVLKWVKNRRKCGEREMSENGVTCGGVKESREICSDMSDAT